MSQFHFVWVRHEPGEIGGCDGCRADVWEDAVWCRQVWDENSESVLASFIYLCAGCAKRVKDEEDIRLTEGKKHGT